ncbi:MAG: RNA methyltransferase [Alphaproteobacteria bacterium]|nr:RNA methyltransferase [Alphaproteobacteria bacterium]
MAGTDSRHEAAFPPAGSPGAAPVIILVAPQLAENIGTAARAMLNCGLTELRLVQPRQSQVAPKALAASSGADALLTEARLFDTVEAAVADLQRVYATTARRREMTRPVMVPRHAVAELRAYCHRGDRCGILFGPERTGLTNDEVSLADVVIEAPLNPAFSSLNLAQAVLVVSYEWYQSGLGDQPIMELPFHGGRLATRDELFNLFAHLERELIACGFLRVVDKRPSMMRNIRTMFERAGLTAQEARTLHGIIKELRWGRLHLLNEEEPGDHGACGSEPHF